MLKLATLLVIVVAFSGAPAETQRRAQSRARPVARDYANFSHTTHVTNEKLGCDSCHKFPTANWKEVRKGDAAFEDVAEFPEHSACLNCHLQQFFARERPVPRICSNCHVKATPSDTTRYPFPSLGQAFLGTVKGKGFVSEFKVQFPHEKHEDAECTSCHEKLEPEPSPPLTHAVCFTCHNQESELEPLPPKCDSCHKPKK